MKKLVILAALLVASTAAHAGNSLSFEVNGHKVSVAVPNNCKELSCIQVSAPGLSGSDFFKSTKSKQPDDDVAKPADPPEQKPVSAPAPQTAATEPPAPPAANNPPAAPAIATAAPTPAATDNVAPAAPAEAATKPPAVAAAPVQAPTTPLGVWNTAENKGLVRIESCGQNLCGYAVKSGEKVLINMKPSDAKWSGQIHDPDGGNTYDANIAMKGPNALRVEGCAFGGLFCGNQTWKRVS
jgi:uncharacterized protein (DUF2147 family)